MSLPAAGIIGSRVAGVKDAWRRRWAVGVCRVLDSADPSWGGPGTLSAEEVEVDKDGLVALQPNSFAVYARMRR